MFTGWIYDFLKDYALELKVAHGELLEDIEDVPDSVIDLLRTSRASLEMFQAVQKRLLDELSDNPLICDRVPG